MPFDNLEASSSTSFKYLIHQQLTGASLKTSTVRLLLFLSMLFIATPYRVQGQSKFSSQEVV